MSPVWFQGRGLAPVIGVTLLVVIAVLLASLSAYFLLGLTSETEPAPEVVFELEKTEQALEYRLKHVSGKQLNGDRIELRGVASTDGITDDRFAAGERVSLYPTQETVKVVWFNDHGESFVLDSFEVERTAPTPDKGCGYVQQLKTNGNSGVNVPAGTVINCDIVASGDVTLKDDAVVLGEIEANGHGIDITGGEVYGPVTADGPVDLTSDGAVYGSITAGGDFNMANSKVGGSVTTTDSGAAVDLDGGTVEGDVVSGGDFNVNAGGRIEGAVASKSNIDVDTATITGHVYGSLSCVSGATINGEPCASYTARSYSEYG